MNAKTRQDETVRLLRRRGSTTVAYLIETLGASRRTVLRDIAALRDQGFDIRTSSGPGGGIYLDPSSILVTPKLTSAEAFALLISVAVLRETHSIPFANLADEGLKKIEQSLPRERVVELRKVLCSVYIGRPSVDMPPLGESAVDESVLPAFETGFLNSQRMQFKYIDRYANTTHRTADPHAMLVLSPYWYLVGFDPEKSAFRHFRMDRIKGAIVLDECFRRRTFTLEEGRCPFTAFSWS